jgi:hypothetical protein
MRNKRSGIVCGAVAVGFALAVHGAAQTPNLDAVAATLTELSGGQQMLELKMRVIDEDGQPVAQAKITPWALRSSQGHGWWREKDEGVGVGPKSVLTGPDGSAVVIYPYYRDVEERIRATSVSLHVDHPKFAYVDALHVDVPLESGNPYEVKLMAGVPVEIRPLVDGKLTNLDDVYAIWSDGRSWVPGAAPEKTPDDTLRIPAMPAGDNSLLLVKLEGDRATHFSKITDFKLSVGEKPRIDVAMHPAVRIEGVLSDNVPRPVRNGRIKIWTLAPTAESWNRVQWFSSVPVRPDGTFSIDGWPAEEPLQLIALCGGYNATSGKAPAVVKNPRDPATDPFTRPQVFEPAENERIEVAMESLVRCVVTAVDEDDKPVAGVKVESWPNVGWWNGGSQIYCHEMARGERLLRERDYQLAVDHAFPYPYEGASDADGKVTLELPAGNEDLAVESNVYELPVFLGRRTVDIKLVRGEVTETTLRLQPRGTEKLGEWDKLAGVVFGCSTREGRRICALPGVQKQMEEFARRFREAKNQRDPQLLSDAYAAVADAFVGVGDLQEAAKWRQKSTEQAALAKAVESTVE